MARRIKQIEKSSNDLMGNRTHDHPACSIVHQPTTVLHPQILSVSEKKEGSAYRDQFPAASQQNIANRFSVLWDKPISQHCVGDILSEKNTGENQASGNREKLKGAKHEKLEYVLAM
jgi:hypothetical protein